MFSRSTRLDLGGLGVLVGTQATTCTVDSDTQITATLPAGIPTNGATGWNVIATHTIGSNVTSTVQFIPVAGLLISEVYIGTSGLPTREFVEIYNPTGTSIDTTEATGIFLRLHVRNSSGTDTGKPPVMTVTTGVIPSRGFLLFVSSASDMTDAWFANRDYTYTAGLVSDGGVYIALGAAANRRVIDKVGWGAQADLPPGGPGPGGCEGACVLLDIPSSSSIERLPAAGLGHATDTDSNVGDFNAPSATITPRGTVDLPQP